MGDAYFLGDPAQLVDFPTLAGLLHRPAWHADGACHEHPNMSWFRSRDVEAARAVCERCLVVAECGAFAVADPSLVGVWGATTEQDRRAIRVARRSRAA